MDLSEEPDLTYNNELHQWTNGRWVPIKVKSKAFAKKSINESEGPSRPKNQKTKKGAGGSG
jgi:hypothetical protein